MKTPKIGTTGKLLLLGGAGLIGASLLGKSGIFDRQGGEGSIGGSDIGGGDFADVSEEPPTYVQNIYYENPDVPLPQETFIPEALTQQVPTFQQLADVNRNIMFDSGLADSGYSTEWGEVFLKDGQIVGGTDIIAGQSLTPQGVADRQAKADNPFSSFYAPEQLMSVDPNQLQSIAPAGANQVATSPFNTVAEVGLAGATLIPSPASRFGENIFKSSLDTAQSTAKPIAKAVGSEVAESGLTSAFKYAGKQGAKAIPFVGLGAGIALDSTGAMGGKKYPVGVATAGNILGDVLGGVGTALTSPLALTGVGAVVPVGAGIGGQILGEQIVYAPYNWFFRGDEDEKDDLQEQVAYAEPPASLMSPAVVNQVSSSSKKRSSSSGSSNSTPLSSSMSSLSGISVAPSSSSSSSRSSSSSSSRKSSSSSSRSSSSSSKSSSSSSKSSSSSSSYINTSRFTKQSGGGYSDNVAKQSVSKSVAQSRSSSFSSYSAPKTSSAPKSYSSYSSSKSTTKSSSYSAPKKTVSKPKTSYVKSFVSSVKTRVSSIFKRK